MEKKKIESYLYTDEAQIRMYLDQFTESKVKKIKKKQVFGISITKGFTYDLTLEEEAKSLTLFDKIHLLESLLRKNNLVADQRPMSMKTEKDGEIKFIFENAVATKLIFTKEETDLIPGVDKLFVWISNPDSRDLSKDDRWFTGTFLYLIEATTRDVGSYTQVFSGVSALLALSNLISGKPFFDTSLNIWEEPLGRSNYKHPIKKLTDLGARVIIEEVKIETLYRCRYITDEQAYTFKGEKKRVCDLLGYPIYIKHLIN